MGTIDTVLFDFDGTLMDTNRVIIQSWQHTFRTLEGREEEVSTLAQSFGEPLHDTMERFFPHVPTEDAVEIYRSYQKDRFLGLIELFDGVPDMLRSLGSAGFKLGIVTSRLRRTTMEALDKYGLSPIFDVIVTPEDTEKHKPDPEPIEIALRRLASHPKHAVMVGDTMYDILCARNAKVPSVLVGWSFALQGVTEFGEHAPDHTIAKPADLLPLLLGSRE